MTVSLLQEFKRSWLTSAIGLVALVAGFSTLTWNEGRAVHHAHSLDEAFSNVIELNVHEPVRSELDGRLVHVSGRLMVDEPLTEPDYGIAIQCVQLKRRVQMYQWVEERTPRDFGAVDQVNDDTNDYYYITEWRDRLVDSRSFYIRHGHQNPTHIPLKSHIHIAPSVKVGNHITLGAEVKRKFVDFLEVTSDERPERKDVKLHLGIYYHSDDVWRPEVGDIRVQFYYAGAHGEYVSVVGMQKDGRIVPFYTSKGHEILLVRHETRNVSDMFHAEHSDALFETWKLRAIGMFMLYAAVVCLSRLLRIILCRVTSRRVLSGETTSWRNMTIAFFLGLFIISFAWLAHRPLLAISLLIASISGVFQNQNIIIWCAVPSIVKC